MAKAAAKKAPAQKPAKRRILLVAEKPSMGHDIAEALCSSGWSELPSQSGKSSGRILENEKEQMFVVWADGHLLEMLEPDDIKPEWGSPWNAAVLPMVPNPEWIPQRVRKGCEKQVARIVRLIPSADEVINACDAGPEGELIFDELALLAGYDQDAPETQARRMWITDTSSGGLINAFNERSRCSLVKYKRLRESAWARTQADWLFGFNATRMATLSFGRPELPLAVVGRVQSPTLGLVVEQDVAIATFNAERFHRIPITFRGETGKRFVAELVAFPELRFGLVDTHFRPLPGMWELRQQLLASSTVPWSITDVPEPRQEHAPPPFDLLDLQRCAARLYGWTAAQTLEVAQKLYLHERAISYPRTDSTKVPPGMRNQVIRTRDHLFEIWAKARYTDLKETQLPVYEDHWENPAGDHHAIIPLGPIPEAWSQSGGMRPEFRLWELIVVRTILAWLPPAKVAFVKRYMMREWGDNVYLRAYTEAEPVDDPGWLWWEDRLFNTRGYGKPLSERMREVAMPEAGSFATFERLDVSDGQTTPPERVDEAMLLGWMGRYRLGTPATRHSIIEDLMERGYLQRMDGAKIYSTSKGRMLIALLKEQGGKDIVSEENARRQEEFITRIGSMAQDRPDRLALWRSIESRLKQMKGVLLPTEKVEKTDPGEAFCPRTGQRVTLHTSGRFWVFPGFPDARPWVTMAGRKMSAADYAAILAGGDRGAGPFAGFRGRTGNLFECHVVFRPRAKEFEMVFKRR